MHDVRIHTLSKPIGLNAGFHAEFSNRASSGLVHGGEQWASSRFLISPHQHDVAEFYLQVSGSTRWQVTSDLVSLKPGDLLVVPAHARHGMSGPPRTSHHFYYAAIDLDAVFERHVGLRSAWSSFVMVHNQGSGRCEREFRQLISEISTDSPFAQEGLVVAVDALVIAVTRLLSKGSTAIQSLVWHPVVHRAVETLDTSYERQWTLRSLAKEVGISPQHLFALFSKQVGTTPRNYQERLRIDRSLELLRHRELSITSIAHELGYASGQHFANAFRRATGTTASAWRKSEL